MLIDRVIVVSRQPLYLRNTMTTMMIWLLLRFISLWLLLPLSRWLFHCFVSPQFIRLSHQPASHSSKSSKVCLITFVIKRRGSHYTITEPACPVLSSRQWWPIHKFSLSSHIGRMAGRLIAVNALRRIVPLISLLVANNYEVIAKAITGGQL